MNFETEACLIWLNDVYSAEKEVLILESRQNEDPIGFLADKLSEIVDMGKPEITHSVYSVLLNKGLDQIDCLLIAKLELEKTV
jgi:hypothetical protein